MPAPDNYPYGKFRFRVECDGLSTLFSEVSGFDANVDSYEYREGAQKTTPFKVAGLRKYGNITLKRAVSKANAKQLWDWWTVATDKEVTRKSLTITLMDNDGTDVASWSVEQAWPVKYTAPDFSATASEAAQEQIELVHEGMTRTA
jgi:phage tail-like protein